jgi:hypothetical protein
MNTDNISLGDFVQQLLLQLEDNELYFRDERPWHELFYQLKTSPAAPGKPRFLSDLFFDWNGAYPRCHELVRIPPRAALDWLRVSVQSVIRQIQVEQGSRRSMADSRGRARPESVCCRRGRHCRRRFGGWKCPLTSPNNIHDLKRSLRR